MERLEEIAQRLENLNPSRSVCGGHARPAGAEVDDEGADVAIAMHPALASRIDGPAELSLDEWSNTLVASVMRILWNDPTSWSDDAMSDRAARARSLRKPAAIDLTQAEQTPTRATVPPPVPESSGPRPVRHVVERVA